VALSEFEIKRCEKLVAEFIERRRPPLRLRKDVDLAFRMKGQSVEIIEIRAHWTGRGKPIVHRIAKATLHIVERRRTLSLLSQPNQNISSDFGKDHLAVVFLFTLKRHGVLPKLVFSTKLTAHQVRHCEQR
jgi:hypothetical protein